MKVIDHSTPDGILGFQDQNKYTVVRILGDEQTFIDRDLTSLIHLVDLLKLRKTCEEEKSYIKTIRRAINSIFTSGIIVFTRIDLRDFDLCILLYHEIYGKLLITPPCKEIPDELKVEARTGLIFEKPELSVIYRHINEERAMFRLSEICKYSNKTLNYIRECMNKK
ncbi:hypothetical protein Hanom_Chr11g01036031 [Helianthus anomalus]